MVRASEPTDDVHGNVNMPLNLKIILKHSPFKPKTIELVLFITSCDDTRKRVRFRVRVTELLTSHRGGGVEVLSTGKYQQLSGQVELRVLRLSRESGGEIQSVRESPDGHALLGDFD